MKKEDKFLASLAEREGFQRKSAQQIVVETLRSAIISGDLPFGARLRQKDLAEQLEVSTTPVREALQELAGEGLVRIDRYRGTFVVKPSLDELHDIYDLRTVVEAHGMRLAIERISEEEIDRAEELIEEMDATSDHSQWVCLNRSFHKILAEATRAPTVAQVLTMLANTSVMYVALSLKADPARVFESNGEHRKLIAASRARDVEKGVDTIRGHMRATLELVESIL